MSSNYEVLTASPEANTMKSEKAYTPAQLDNADRTMALLATLPENRRSMAITMANAFIAGMEAQARIAAAQAEPNQTAAQS